MTILILFIVFVLTVAVLIEIRERKRKALAENGQETDQQTVNIDPNCCGAHLVCERDLMANPISEIVYYDDEELDSFAGIKSDEYTDEQVAQFSDVFYTLQESDVVGWLRSLSARNVQLPDQLKDEALMIVNEQRGKGIVQ